MKYFKVQNYTPRNRKYIQTNAWVGRFEQCHPKSICTLPIEGKINYDPIMPHLKMWETSDWTDLIRSNQINSLKCLLVSSKLLEIIKKLSSKNIQIFKTKLSKLNETRIYHTVYMYSISNEIIDFHRSDFVTFNSPFRMRTKLKLKRIKNLNSFNRQVKSKKTNILYHNLILKRDDEKHLFRLNLGSDGTGIYASELFVEECKKKNIKGIKFQSLEEIKHNYFYRTNQYIIEN